MSYALRTSLQKLDENVKIDDLEFRKCRKIEDV